MSISLFVTSTAQSSLQRSSIVAPPEHFQMAIYPSNTASPGRLSTLFKHISNFLIEIMFLRPTMESQRIDKTAETELVAAITAQ